MKRRQLLRHSAIFLGAASVGGSAILFQSCKPNLDDDWTPVFLTQEEAALLSEVSETYIPATSTPGAKDAKVARYLDEYADKFLEPDEKVRYKQGLALYDTFSNELHQKNFIKLSAVQKAEVLKAMATRDGSGPDSSKEVFKNMRSLVTSAFFTSEIGATKVLEHVPIPGNYTGEIALKDTKGVLYSG